MTRILYWNVNNFGKERFFCEQYRKVKRQRLNQGGMSDIDAARVRLNCLYSAISLHQPDILVIVETTTGTNGLPEGEMVDERSSILLMNEIRDRTNSNNWYVVPPLISGTQGRAECITVLYNSTHLTFTGPWRWPGGVGPAGSVATIPDTNMGFYAEPFTWLQDPADEPGPGNLPDPTNWKNTLPNRDVPADSAFNADQHEYQVAGQWDFHVGGNPANAQLNFPSAGCRRPFLTTFYDTSVAQGNYRHREIRLLSFHASPRQFQKNPVTRALEAGPASTGTAQIANIFEMNQPLAANQVNVIVGDFNIPLWNWRGVTLSNAYTPITALGYTQMLQAVPDTYPDKAYRITHTRPVNKADAYNTNGFPGFGYMSNPGAYGRYDAIDNIFVRYPTANNMAGGPATNMTIVNQVAGSPYVGGGLPPLPAGVPVGTGGSLAYGQNLNDPTRLPIPGGIQPPDHPSRKSFRGWDNYRRLRSTSDHLALIVDV